MPDAVRSALAGTAPLVRGEALRLEEVAGRDLVELAAWPETFAGVTAELAALTGLGLPADTRRAATTGEATVFMVGPQRLWIAAPAAQGLEARLRAAWTAERAAVAALGHARTVIRIAGPRASALLARGVAIDLDEAAFPVGAFAQTRFCRTGVLLHRTGATAFDLYVPRSFARAVWDWLADTAALCAG